MATLPAIQVTEQGLFLPRHIFQDLGEIQVVQQGDYILIKSKDMTTRFKGFVHPHLSVEQLHQDYESSLMEGPGL